MKRTFFSIVLCASALLAWAQAPVFIVAGQSNADGRVRTYDYPTYLNPANCLYCYDDGSHFRNGQFETYRPYTHVSGDSERFGFDAFVYHYLSEAYQSPFYVVKLTLGGTAIDPSCQNSNGGKYWCVRPDWYNSQSAISDGGKSLMKSLEKSFTACLEKTLSALEQGYDVKAIIWHQGESDYMYNGPENYYENFSLLISHLRHFLATATGREAYEHLPFILGSVPHVSKQYNAQVEAAHFRVAEEDPDVYCIDMSDAVLLDDYHFCCTSAEKLGVSVFKQLVSLGIAPDVQTEFSPFS